MSDISLDIALDSKDLDTAVKSLKDVNSNLNDVTNNSKSVTGAFSNLNKSVSESVKKVNDIGKSFDSSIKKGMGFDKVEKGINKAFNGAKKSVENFDKAIKSLPIVGLVTAVAGLSAAFSGLSSAMNASSEALNVQIKAERQLSIAVSSNSKLTNESAKNLAKYASELQGATEFGDEYTMSLMRMGAQAGMTEQEIKDMTTLALDISAQSGLDAEAVMKKLTTANKDASSAAMLLKEANVALTLEERKMIVELQTAGKQTEANNLILEKLSSTYGGSASKNVETFAGKQKQLSNTMGDVQEEFGRVVQAISSPFLDVATNMWNKFYAVLTNESVVKSIQSVITGFQLLGDIVGGALRVGFDYLITAFDLLTTVPQLVIKGIIQLSQGFAGLSQEVTWLGDGIKSVAGFFINFADVAISSLSALMTEIRKLNDPSQWSSLGKSFEGIGQKFSNLFNGEANRKAVDDTEKYIKDKFNKVKVSWAFAGGFESENKKIESSLEKTSKKIESDNKKTTEKVKTDWKDATSSITSSIGSMASSITNAFFSMQEQNNVSFDSYDENIERIKAKYEELQATKENSRTQSEDMYSQQVEYLEDEYNRQDELGKQAIKIKLDELKNLQKTNSKAEKEAKDLANKEAEIEKAKEKEIALAEYQKAVAIHNNDIQNAETKKKQAIAEGALSITQGAVLGALSLGRSIAELGPIAGAIAGVAALASITGAVAGAVSGISGATAELNTVKSSAPKPPAFRFGTSGYELENGASAIVGEAGQEVVTNRDGKLQVESAYQTSMNGSAESGGVYNISINASQFSESELMSMLSEILTGNSIKKGSVLNNV